MKKSILFSIILFFSLSVTAQNVLFEKSNFPGKKKELKEVKKALKLADKYMQTLPAPMYTQALEQYLLAQDLNPNNAQVNYMLGLCYMNTTQKFKALNHFQTAYELDKNAFPDIDYRIGRGLHLAMDWDGAIKSYKKAKRKLNKRANPDDLADIEKKIAECETGKEMVKDVKKVWIDNLGENINSQYPEYGMVLTADASEIFFTSRRPNTTGGKTSPYDDFYYEDIYTSNRYGSKNWSSTQNVGEPLNTKGHDAAVALSPDGSKMIIYLDDKGDGNLYESMRTGDTWSAPQGFNKEINSKYHESSAWYSPDGNQLYFVSERPVRQGQGAKDKDIYVATWNEIDEKWDNVVRLPDNVNTEYDEDGVFAHPDGKTIYFSSKGHNTIGGYDVFKSTRQEDGTWSDPVNLGYPINTTDDDVFFTVAANGRDGYMTSYREDGMGDKDLYKITMIEDKAPILAGEDMLLANEDAPIQAAAMEPLVNASGSKLMILKGIVRDALTKEPIKSSIELVDNGANVKISEFGSDAKSGRYLVALPGGKDYGIAVTAPGYLFHSENFNVKESDGYKEVELDIYLNKVAVGGSIALRNVFFDYAKYSLRQSSIIELNRLIDLMNEYPTMKIELSGHTDSRGSASYNKTLSDNRAKSVLDYLVEHGIERSRMEANGYGFDHPIVTDAEIAKMVRNSDKEDAHQRNRRTEFKITAM